MKGGLGKGEMCVGCVSGGGVGVEKGESGKEKVPPSAGVLSVHPGCAPSLFVMSSEPAGRRGSFIALSPAACC